MEKRDHDDSDASDAVVVWGKRTGRGLGYVAALLLLVSLLARWFG